MSDGIDSIQPRNTVSMETEQSKFAYRRLWEVDTVRGIAVVLMICYHFIFDLAFFGAYDGNMYSASWQLVARSIGTTFILVLGVSLTLRHNRLTPQLDQKQLLRKYLLRGVTLFGWGMVVTVVTYFVLGRGFVVFGILHLLGLSVILAFPFLRSRWVSLAAGIAAIGLGLYLGSVKVLSPWLLWLGVPQLRRYMVDYYPIFPWFGFALLGAFVGFTLYPGGLRRFALPDLSHTAPIRALTYLGRHSLLIYLIHQPILLGILILVGIGSF
jgi:uncharacterized membrane protein